VGIEATILDLAARQHGVVARSQLLGAGVPEHAVDYRLNRSRLRAIHRGVYASGPIAGPYQREAAAVLSYGKSAVLSHRTAAGLWRLTPPQPLNCPVDVTRAGGRRRPRRGVRLHHVERLLADEKEQKEGLPLTTPARTLLDLASCSGPHELERAFAAGERHGVVTRDAVEALLGRHPGRRGVRALRALIEAPDGPALTRSEAEARFRALLRRAAVPRPEANVLVEGLEVDFVWRAQSLVVEIDGFAHHAGRQAFERDRQRDGVLVAAGFRVLRVTWPQLANEPEALLVRLARALAIGGRERGRR
jgi:very-short-patch-repair endonuclease